MSTEINEKNGLSLEKEKTSRVVSVASSSAPNPGEDDQITLRGSTQDECTETDDGVTGLRLVLIQSGLCLGVFIVGLDLNIIATAIPLITAHFDSIHDVGWYGSAFFIALCASQPLAGKLFMLFPKKITFLCYVAIFEVGSLVCATATTSNALIVGRAIAGLGTSGIFGGSMIIIAMIVPLHKRAIWIGILNSVWSVASIVGPLVGGALTQHVSWRWCFYINLPVGGASALVILSLLRLKKAPTELQSLMAKLKGLDAFGFLLFAGSMTMLLLALEWGGNNLAWNSPTVIGLLVGFGVGLVLFIMWQLHMKDTALIPPKTFANRNVKLIMLSALFVNGPFQIIVYWMPIWFQAVLGESPSGSAVRYLPTVISDVCTAMIGGTIVTKLGIWNPFLLFGDAFLSIGAGLLTTIYPIVSSGHWIGYQIMVGVGFAFALNMEFIGLQASIPADLVSIGSASLLTFFFTSCAIFLSIGQAVFEHRLVANLGPIDSNEVARKLLSVGATDIRSVVGPSNFTQVINAYSKSITQVFYIPAVCPAIAFCLVIGCKWISTKQPTATSSEHANKSDKKETA